MGEKARKQGQGDLLKALFFCLLAVIVVRSFIIEPFKIPSSSMLPTLKIGDHIFVTKFNFGLSLSFPYANFELIQWGFPKRGEIIVFLFPKDKSLHYIKRVIGLPGDTVEIEGKEIKVNGNVIAKTVVKDATLIQNLFPGEEAPPGIIYEEIIEGKKHYVRYTREDGADLGRIKQKLVVPKDTFFVMGDNRDDSYDSRSWGPVERKYIKGRAQIVWLSLDQDIQWGNLNKVRWSRSGLVIR